MLLSLLYWVIIIAALYGAAWFITRQVEVMRVVEEGKPPKAIRLNLNQEFQVHVWPIIKTRPAAFALGALAVAMFLSATETLEVPFEGKLILMTCFALIGWFTTFKGKAAFWGSVAIGAIGIFATLALHQNWSVQYSKFASWSGLDPVGAFKVSRTDRKVKELGEAEEKNKDQRSMKVLEEIEQVINAGRAITPQQQLFLESLKKVPGEESLRLELGKYTRVVGLKEPLRWWYLPAKCCVVFRNILPDGRVEYFATAPEGSSVKEVVMDGITVPVITSTRGMVMGVIDAKPTLEGDRIIRFVK